MSGAVHQLFSTEADLSAAWERYAAKARAIEANPRLKADRASIDELLAAFSEYRRLFDLKLEREREGARA